ncbi:unnamed protein product [Nezara viridula]|uniref:Uncharacterized protein n=1 Tax=Nezara viridula TaxID=85310 RepID=A0A9P0HPT9_NEZVI|nr:unnamed protein product [Nezara viridula]
MCSIWIPFWSTHSFNLTSEGVETVLASSHSSFLRGVKKRMILMSCCAIPQNFYPLTLGFTKAIQMRQNDEFGDKVWPIVIHVARGLASQGIVYETLKLNNVKNYETFGTIHLIFNNQMEQTIKREMHMTLEYCTDTLRTLNIPIFHVNGDDLVAVHFIMRLAADFRAQFRRDVAVDIVSYSRFMTQRAATKYEFIQVQQAIMHTEPVVHKYIRELINEGVITQSEVDIWRKNSLGSYADAWQKAAKMSTGDIDRNIWHSQLFLDQIRKDIKKLEKLDKATGIDRSILKKICDKFSTVPDSIKLSPKHLGLLKRRRYLIENDKLDWVICEALAYGSLLLEGNFVRISGMDVNRRLHILEEATAGGQSYDLLNNLDYQQAKYIHCKSTTSQYATAAFEYGYSCATTRTLVVWEAPEGDKTSKAQVVIDHYFAGGYLKYNYHSNIIFLIPHYHRCETVSKVCNGRPERFLQLANDCETATEINVNRQFEQTNMILTNVSTPANFFHVIRRQLRMAHRRPLVVFTPNLLISSAECKAQMKQLETGTKFQPYFPDPSIKDIFKVKKILLCTGKVYYDLKNERKNRGLDGKIAICRIEQICPLPYQKINADLLRYYTAKVAWVQEEPLNQGWWTYVEHRLLNLPCITRLECIARPPRADGGSRSVQSCFEEHSRVMVRAMTLENN